MKKTLLALALFALLPTFGASAIAAEKTNYIPEGTLNPSFLNTPPQKDSPQWKSDVAMVLEMNKNINPEQLAQIKDEAKLQPAHLTKVIDPDWDEKKQPALFSLLNKVESDCENNVRATKKFWNTKRPYLEDENIKAALPNVTSGAYPSGHTACSLLLAMVLGELAPAKKDVLRIRASQIGMNRIIAGLHYMHDIQGGRMLGAALFGALQMSPAYQADFKAAQAEIPSMPAVPAAPVAPSAAAPTPPSQPAARP